jgi:hypothetical protein
MTSVTPPASTPAPVPSPTNPVNSPIDLLSLVKASGGARIATLAEDTAVAKLLGAPLQQPAATGLDSLLSQAFLYRLAGAGNAAAVKTYQDPSSAGQTIDRSA